jgi:hypothetical protein
MSILIPSGDVCLADPTLTRKPASELYERPYRKLTQVDG